jgi:glutathione synthase/RimK-type ligase-like ATP-grasp enzyme
LIIVITHPEDLHSFLVAEALHRKGAELTLLYSTDFPTLQAGSIWLSPQGGHWDLSGTELKLGSRARSTIWLRRAAPPVLPDFLDAADRQFASRECVSFLNCLVAEIGQEAFWVNSITGATRANLKTRQLRAALRAGLTIPSTLCSNDPSAIRKFAAAHQGSILYKTFYPASWNREDGISVLFSSQVHEDDLPEDPVLQAVPGIFQAVVPKLYELRITVMGHRVFATKIDSQAVLSAQMDWRAASGSVPLSSVDLPSSISQACLSIMDDLGIVFGCFDMIVTPAGEYVFLEVNEMGAFLWIERQNPEIKLLEPFCELLLQRNPDFHWSEAASTIRIEDIWSEAFRKMEASAMTHVRKESDTSQES